jgi:leucine dehydrogenase
MWEVFEERAERCIVWTDRASGLRAVVVLDDMTLGPAAGGVRTRAYASLADAVSDASKLARAMTHKCALAGLAAGGGKAVVLDHAGLDRARAFARLGVLVEELGGLFRTAGDLGTTAADLEQMARHTRYVHTDATGLSEAVGRGLLRCIEACARERGVALRGLRVAIQGAGAIGGAAARALAEAGAEVTIADVDGERVRALASETGASIASPAGVLELPVDVVAPCAVGGVVDEAVARRLNAWAVCGAANNILADDATARVLRQRGILHVPDVIASAGAVIEGIGRTVMCLPDRRPLIDRLGATASEVFARARSEGVPESVAALALARSLLEAGERHRLARE